MRKKNLIDYISLIKSPVITEKSVNIIENNQYTFLVDRKMTKMQLKKAIEFLFDVKVLKVNSLNLAPKIRRVGRNMGLRSKYKKIIFHLSDSDKINLFDI